MYRIHPTARSWLYLSLPAMLAFAACDRTPTEPGNLESLAAKGGPSAGPLIAFTRYDNGTNAIYTVHPDGTGLRRVTRPNSGDSDSDPNFAPGNGSLVFTRELWTGGVQLFSVNLKGGKLKQLTSFTGQSRSPVYSPDGSRIAFRSNMDGQGEIYLINADGTGLQRLTNTPEYEHDPTWSPDGTVIAYSVTPANGTPWPSRIEARDLVGGGPTLLVDCPTSLCSTPRWSRAGAELIYQYYESGAWSLRWKDMTTLVDLPYETAGGTNLAGEWLPDGSGFVFSSTRSLNGSDVYIRHGQNPPVQVTFGLPQVAGVTISR